MVRASDSTIARRAWRYRIAAWTLGLVVCVVSVAAWLESFDWQLPPFNAYIFFPLLGLLAYGLLWSQYAVGAIKELLHIDKSALTGYFKWTGLAVLVLICLHPGLLIYQRFRDGFGLPPGSYESYVRPGLGWITLLGTASLLVFLSYELYRWFDNRAWWSYVLVAVDVAMLAIFYHGLRLGQQTGHGWFHYVWWFYGLTLVAILGRKYILKYTQNQDTQNPA